jgi:MscS family membrane protein
MRRMIRKVLCLVCFGWLAAISLSAQGFSLTGRSLPTITPVASSDNSDSLGRETPHGAIVGFLRSAQDEKYSLATQYFEPSSARHRLTQEQEQELAQELLTILNQKFGPILDSISRDPQGRLDDGRPADEETISTARGDSSSFSLQLVRIEDEHGRKLWLISRKTLADVPKLYDSLRFPQLEKRLPRVLVETRPFGVPLWQWLVIVVLLPVSLFISWPLLFVGRRITNAFLRRRGAPLPVRPQVQKFGPAALMLALFLHYNLVYFVGISLLYRQYYTRVIWILLVVAFYWGLTRATSKIAEQIGGQLSRSGRLAEGSLISLARRLLNAFIFVFVALIVLSTLGVNVTAALAGLGIGGLAIGLGAQKTFENLLGGIAILSDRALQIGDACRIGDQTGTVEDIGLRSTKIRTQDRTLVSIPNGTVATAVLENYRWRDKILTRHIVRLPYDLSLDHLHYVLDQMRAVLNAHPKIEAKTWRVRLLRFADYAYEVEVYGYALERDYNEFLAVQEDVLLKITEAIERAGSGFALPSSTQVLVDDKWPRSERAKAAEEAIKKTQDPGVPAPDHPQFTPDVAPPKS